MCAVVCTHFLVCKNRIDELHIKTGKSKPTEAPDKTASKSEITMAKSIRLVDFCTFVL